MTLTYKEYTPSAQLQPYVDNYTYMVFDGHGEEESPIQRCLPLGMTQIIIHVNQVTSCALTNGEWQQLPNASFIGIHRDPVSWKTTGRTVMFGITMKPEAVMQLFRVPVSDLFNAHTDLESFLGRKTELMTGRMYGVECPQTLINISEQFMLQQLNSMNASSNYIDDAVSLIRKSEGTISIDELSRQLYVSERKLQRGFKDILGTNPKMYTRIIRFRNAYEFLQHNIKDEISWSDVSYHFGYADQAHFIREFREFAGENPTRVIDNKPAYYQLNEELVYG
jgi:AraC-like DNA-binding protein